MGIGLAGAEHDEIVEYEDSASNKEIEEDFLEWVNNYLDSEWWEED